MDMERSRLSLADMAYAKVKERIILNEYRGGQTLDEASLARQLELTGKLIDLTEKECNFLHLLTINTRPVSRLVLGGIQAVQRQVDEGRYAGIAGPAGVGLGNHDLRDLRHQREFRGREELRRRRRDSRLGLLVAALQYRQRRGRRDRAT